MRRALSFSALAFAILAAGGVAACQGCHTPPAATQIDAASGKPTIRLYAMSTVAGALEPCGCSKDQLGGIDHLAAYIQSQAAAAPFHLAIGAGPLLFMESKLSGDQATQDTWKADAIALAAKDLGLVAWAPGANDWAAGADALGKFRDEAGAKLLAGNLDSPAITGGTVLREIGGVKVGIVGVSDPRDRAGAYPDALPPPKPALEAMKRGVAELQKQGAQVLIGLAAIPRGDALRIADELPDLHVLLIGKPSEMGHANDAQKAPVMVGSTLVVETANHLQTVSVIDLFVRQSKSGEKIVFADAGGVARADELLGVSRRIHELETRLNTWEGDPSVKPADVAARKADLDKLRAEKAKLEAEQPAVAGSFFRVSSLEVREQLGRDKAVADRMLEYYKRVNAHNKQAFADRKPPPVEEGKASYIGVDACSACHDDARKVWDGTRHAHAYASLQQGFKEYNLDCVSCHVTGYGRAGGSTVTFNDKLQNVQCEECHGPGSLHAKSPKQKGLIVAKPAKESCASSCHHPPHVEGFNADEKMKLILGPGHGM